MLSKNFVNGFLFSCPISIAKPVGAVELLRMSQTSKIDIDHLSKLARIALTEDEKKRFAEQLGTILDYFEQIKSVNVDGVEPSAHPFPVYNILRDDESGPMLDTEVFMKIAPASRDHQVMVPRVVDDEG